MTDHTETLVQIDLLREQLDAADYAAREEILDQIEILESEALEASWLDDVLV